jgi:hypothetical protein
MKLQVRINLLIQLGKYFFVNNAEWTEIKLRAERENGWFTQDFIDQAVGAIQTEFLVPEKLQAFVERYAIPAEQVKPLQIGLVMAGNIPLVGFHDWLCVFLSGHRALVKASAKDSVLIKHIIQKLAEWDPETNSLTVFSEMLKGCDAYIATGSNNSARYFEYYFKKYPHIIRRNRTSVAILTGKETTAALELLADDTQQYFGLGCRNVTSIRIPRGYDFVPLLAAFKKYNAFADHNKYKNNYDYQLAIALLNNVYYMTNGSILLIENDSLFSPISQLNYWFYDGSPEEIITDLDKNPDLQCVIGSAAIPFGQAQKPRLTDFADGIDTMQFLLDLNKDTC